MKKITHCLLPIALGLSVSQASFAENTDKYRISQQCLSVINHLEILAHNKSVDDCTGNIEIAAAYITAANIKINHNKYDDALILLQRGENELYNIAYINSYCTYFAPLVKKDLGRLIEIISEVEEFGAH